MSTNKTPNYQLHSWLPEDEFHVAEINENFSKLDDSLKRTETALTAMINTRVQMITGCYIGKTGDRKDPQTATHVSLGFQPKAVMIVNAQRYISGADMSFLLLENGVSSAEAVLTEDGFTVINASSNGALLNYAGTAYHYIAFY